MNFLHEITSVGTHWAALKLIYVSVGTILAVDHFVLDDYT